MPDDPRALDRQPADLTPPLRSDVAAPPVDHRSRLGRRLLGFGALLLLAAGLAIGVQQHYRQHLEVAAAAEEQHDFVPGSRRCSPAEPRYSQGGFAGHDDRL
jgi:hypothetical protein